MSSELTIGVVDMEAKAEQEMAPIMQRAAAYVVRDEQTYLDADLVIKTIREKVKEREAELVPPKEAATKAWKAMCALVKKYIDDPLEACKTLDRKRYAWKKAEDAKRAAEAERIRMEAQKAAEAERRAEAARLEAEAKARADEALATAERLRAAGMGEQAEQVLSTAGADEAREVEQAKEVLAAPVAPVYVDTPQKVEAVQGQSQTEHWTATIVNPDLVPREFCVPSQVKLNEFARLMKSRAAVPGVKFEDVGKTTRRGA